MTENNNFAPFIPFLDFNHPILIELDKKIRALLEDKPINLSRELQIRTMIYIDFNKYLTVLAAKEDESRIIPLLEQLDQTPPEKRSELITAATNQTTEELLNNFMKLFSPQS